MIDEVRTDEGTIVLRALYEEHAPSLFRVAVALVGEAAAEDLVHDAFLRYHRVAPPPAPGWPRWTASR